MLASTAICLAACQLRAVAAAAATADTSWFDSAQRLLLLMPRSLHCGWVTAATLVNWNAYIGFSRAGPAAALSTAILSVAAATLAACAFASAGTAAATVAIAWALFALSCGKPVGGDAAALGDAALRGLAQAERRISMLLLAGLVASTARRVAGG